MTCPQTTLAPAATTTCTATYTVTLADMNAGSIANTATTAGTPPAGAPVTDSDSTTVTATQTPQLTIVKTTSAVSYNAVGQVLTFTLTTTNTGNVALTNVVVTDAFATIGSCTPTAPATLAPSEAMTCTATHAVTQADLNSGKFDNNASATGTTPTSGTVTDDSNLVTVPAVQNPAVTLTKATTETTYTTVGQQIAYTITALNSGNVTLTGVTITDPNAVIGVCTPTAPTTLAPGQSITCPATHTVTQADLDTGSITNTARVNGDTGVLTIAGTSNTIVVPRGATPQIPRTGSDTNSQLTLAGGIVIAGLAFLVITRRRRSYYLVLPPL